MAKHTRASFDDPKVKAVRFACFKRDGFKCVICGSDKEIEHHHVLRVADRPDLEFVVSNTVTLCKLHHDQVTGKEKFFEDEFRKIIKENQAKSGQKSGYTKRKSSIRERKYIPRSPLWRF